MTTVLSMSLSIGKSGAESTGSSNDLLSSPYGKDVMKGLDGLYDSLDNITGSDPLASSSGSDVLKSLDKLYADDFGAGKTKSSGCGADNIMENLGLPPIDELIGSLGNDSMVKSLLA